MLRIPLISFALAARAAVTPLYDALTTAPFLHAGTVSSADAFAFIGRECSYLEPENVTVAPASGIGWTEGGSCVRLTRTTLRPPAAPATATLNPKTPTQPRAHDP